MTKPREFWIDKDDYNEAFDSCDLGDSRSAKIAFYPHKEFQTPNMFKVREVLPNDSQENKVNWEKVWAVKKSWHFNLGDIPSRKEEELKIQELVEKSLKGEL